ncbi:MAG TPA: putative collagen-binding domain-containing protein [Thermoguttaceae bacterium]|nr:putative collagen-binding domain-containing protein [Thermoguttaceae bacterium]
MDRREFLARTGQLTTLAVGLSSGFSASRIVGQEKQGSRQPATGPLRVSPKNSHYFCDASGREVLLVGSHTWNSLVDMGRSDPPEAFDFDAYLDFLDRYGHNFIRLWTWDSTTWDTRANGRLGKDFIHHVAPLPWARTGPGKALDGKPKFDLKQYDAAYFERLRARVGAAGRRGIYVSVMLFEGWGLMHGNRRRGALDQWAWRTHPFHPDNNASGIDAGGKVHSLSNPAVNELQAAYIRKVVDTVNDLDNVLYEVINEGGEPRWDWWVVDTVRKYQETKPQQHPIGITGHGAEDVKSMLASPADWISPGRRDGFGDDPPAWDSKKVSLLDTDHVWGVGGNGAWVWKSLVRGHNPLFMDPYDGLVLGNRFDPQWEPIRRNLGYARRLASRLDLAAMSPHDDLASTLFCLAAPGNTYVMYIPTGGKTTVALRETPAQFAVEWFNPSTGKAIAGKPVAGGADREFTAPFAGDAVLYLFRS